MKNKKYIFTLIAIIVIVLIGVAFIAGREDGESTSPPRQPLSVARDFIDEWHSASPDGVSAQIENVKEFVTPEFIRSLDSKLSSGDTSDTDPVTCLSGQNPRFSLVLKDKTEDEVLVDVRERTSEEADDPTSLVSMVNVSGEWKVRDVSCNTENQNELDPLE